MPVTKFKISQKLDHSKNYGYGAPITVYFGGHLFPNYIMYTKYFHLNHHLLPNYYNNYQNYQLEHCNLGINVTNKVQAKKLMK